MRTNSYNEVDRMAVTIRPNTTHSGKERAMSELHSTNTVEQLAIRLIERDILFVSPDGHVMRRGRFHKKYFRWYESPRRIDYQCNDGYCRFSIYEGGKAFVVYVHRLVWVMGNGDIPAGFEVDHKDEIKSNNRPENLQLKTHQQNIARSTANRPGRPGGSTDLTEPEVLEIRRRRARGERGAALAREFGTTPQNITKIVKRINWKHVA